MFDMPTAFHEGGGRHRKPQDGRSCCESSGRLVGCSKRPRPHGRGLCDTEKSEPSSSKWEEVTKGAATPVTKAAILPARTLLFTTLAMACVSFTTTMPTRPSGVFHPELGRKTKKPLDPYRFGGNINTCHCHSHALPGKCRTHFSH